MRQRSTCAKVRPHDGELFGSNEDVGPFVQKVKFNSTPSCDSSEVHIDITVGAKCKFGSLSVEDLEVISPKSYRNVKTKLK